MEDYEPVNSIISSILRTNGIEDKVTLNYGKNLGCPEEFAIYHKKLGWYYYISDDRNNSYYKGPYDINALIQIVTYEFPLDDEVTDKISENYPSEKLENYEYINYKMFYSEQEIDAFEVEHPEKKVE